LILVLFKLFGDSGLFISSGLFIAQGCVLANTGSYCYRTLRRWGLF